MLIRFPSMHERKQRKRVQRAHSRQVVQIVCDVELCGALQWRELQKAHESKKKTTTFKWVREKKNVMKEVCRGREGGGGCICVRAGANEVRDGAGSSRRRCYCHSQQPPGPHVLYVTELAQIMPA